MNEDGVRAIRRGVATNDSRIIFYIFHVLIYEFMTLDLLVTVIIVVVVVTALGVPLLFGRGKEGTSSQRVGVFGKRFHRRWSKIRILRAGRGKITCGAWRWGRSGIVVDYRRDLVVGVFLFLLFGRVAQERRVAKNPIQGTSIRRTVVIGSIWGIQCWGTAGAFIRSGK